MTRPIKGYHVSVFFQRTIPVAVEKDQISAAVKFCKAKQIENFFKWIAKKKKTAKTEINLESSEIFWYSEGAMHKSNQNN